MSVVQADLLEAFRIHEHIHVAILVEIAVGHGFDEGALHGVRRLVAHHGFDPVRNAPHVDGGCRRALAGMHAFGFEDDIKLAVLMFDDIALANAACDNLDHCM